MALMNGKCPVCIGEQMVESTDAITECMFCGSLINIHESIQNYIKNGVYRMTEQEVQQEVTAALRYANITNISTSIAKDGSGKVNLTFAFVNRSPVPAHKIKLYYCLVDESGTVVEGSQVNSYAEASGNFTKDLEFTFNGHDIYLTGQSMLLQNVYLLIKAVAIFYDNEQKMTINSRMTKYIRSDINDLPKSIFSFEDEKISKEKAIKPSNNGDKNWMIYVFLAFILGPFGAHNFYAGNKKRAIIQLILTLTLIGSIVAGPWVIIEAITAMSTKVVPDYGIEPRAF